MKKKLFFALIAMSLLMFLLPVAVAAMGGYGITITTYEMLLQYMPQLEGFNSWAIDPSPEGFGWPENEDITLTFESMGEIDVIEDWTIPENVTIVMNQSFNTSRVTLTVDGTLICNGQTNRKFKPAHNVQNPDKKYQTTYAGTNLIVNGSVTLKYYQDDRFFQNIVVNDGGVLNVKYMIVDESGSLTVHEGGKFEGNEMLTVYGKAEFSNKFYLERLNAPTGTVVITETGEISCEMVNQLHKAEIAGELSVFSSLGLSIYDTADKTDGTIELKETGKLHLLPGVNMFRNNTGNVYGTGTLCIYGWPEEDYEGRPQIFGTSLYGWPGNSIDGISADVTIRANWKQPDECEHTFAKSPYTVESSCKDGYTVYLCSACNAPVKRDIVPASRAHQYNYTYLTNKEFGDYYVITQREDGSFVRDRAIVKFTAKYSCGICYEQERWITLTAADAVYTGEPIETAVLTDETGAIATDVEIVYTNNIEIGEATAKVLLPMGWDTETVELRVNFRIEEAPVQEFPDGRDLTLLIRYFAGWPVEEDDLKALDFNHDGQINRKDAMYLARCFAGWPNYKLTNR